MVGSVPANRERKSIAIMVSHLTTQSHSLIYLTHLQTHSFDNTGSAYNVTRILTPEKTLDVAEYKKYSPLFLGTFFSLTYGVSFGALSSVIVHTIIFHGAEIVERWKLARNQDADVHLKMMRKYKDTPNWWYYALFLVLVALSLVTVLVWDTHLTWWALIIAFLLSIVFLVPIGMVQGITNTQLGLNVLTEFIVGYMLPGRPIAMMLFKTFGYITMAQALYFIQDMKFGHYLKVPVSYSRIVQFIFTTPDIANPLLSPNSPALPFGPK